MTCTVHKNREAPVAHAAAFSVANRVYALQDANFNVTALVTRFTLIGDGSQDADQWDQVGQDVWGWTEDTGWYDNRHRVYSATMARFGQAEPYGAEYTDGANLYWGLVGNPINLLDPTGLYGFRGIPYAPNWMNNMISGLDNFFYPAPGEHPLAEWIDNNISPWFLDDPGTLGSLVPVVGPFRKATSNVATGHPVYGSLWVLATALDVCTVGEASVGRGGLMRVGAAFSKIDGAFRHMAWEVGGQTRHLWRSVVQGRRVVQAAESLGKALQGESTFVRNIVIPILNPAKALEEGAAAFNCMTATISAWSRAGGPLVIWAGWRTAQTAKAVADEAVDTAKDVGAAAVTAPASSCTSALMNAVIDSVGPIVPMGLKATKWILP